MQQSNWLDCVVFMLIESDQVLVEHRKLTKRVEPGIVALPGGHIEKGESVETTLCREMDEELAVKPDDYRYVCTLLHRSQEQRRLHYYAVCSWIGEIQVLEAESLHWITLDELHRLDLKVDRLAVQEYLRVYVNIDD